MMSSGCETNSVDQFRANIQQQGMSLGEVKIACIISEEKQTGVDKLGEGQGHNGEVDESYQAGRITTNSLHHISAENSIKISSSPKTEIFFEVILAKKL